MSVDWSKDSISCARHPADGTGRTASASCDGESWASDGESGSGKKADRQTAFYTNGVRLICVFGRIEHGIEVGADSIGAIRRAGGTGRIRVSTLAGVIFRTVRGA